jgi:FkbM family methyltransferase
VPVIASMLEHLRVLLSRHQATRDLIRNLVPDRIAVRLQVAATEQGIRTFRRRTAHHRFGDQPLKVLIADPVGEEWYDHDWPLPAEVALLTDSKLVEGATVIEVGAHQAVVAMMLAGIVGPSGRVVAVEANPHDYAVACENLKLNKAANIVMVNRAAAAAPGLLTFNITGRVSDDATTTGNVLTDAVTVDMLAEEYGQPDVIFIDTEGYEGEVLKGAKTALQASPDVFVEVHAGRPLRRFDSSVRAILDCLSSESYEVLVGTDAYPFAPLDEVDPELLDSRFFLVARKRESHSSASTGAGHVG